MLRYNNPFIGRALRYVVSWLILGLLLPIILFPASPFLAVGSILLALLITFGWDAAMHQFSKYKAASITKEEIQEMLPAIMTRADWKGFVVMTDSYILFAPHMHKVTFITEWEHVHSFDIEGGYVELLFVQGEEKRTVHFIVPSSAKAREAFSQHTKEARLEVEV